LATRSNVYAPTSSKKTCSGNSNTLLRKPNQSFELLGNRVSQDLHDQFKDQISMRQRQHDQQLTIEAQDSSYADTLGRIKGLFGLRSEE